MKVRVLIHSAILLLLITETSVFAQSEAVSFPAKDLQLVSQRYTGSSVNWPLVVELATHNVNDNFFTLEPSDILQLQNFADYSTLVSEQKLRVSELIKTGATLFAFEQYTRVNETLENFNTAVNAGMLEKAIESAQNLKGEVDQLENTLMNNRIVDIQAQLSRKKGEVDKRKGLLGSWTDAMTGDLFKQSDGIRTFTESYATLSFVDGSDIQVNPNTVAVIRKSRIDKLNDATDTEITLEDGGVLAKLSSAGKNRSTYILNAGPSRSQLKSQNFYAEADGNQIAKLSNYDGEAIVNSNDVTITIQENEGTIVEEGKNPMQPVKLLPRPSLAWSSADTVINQENFIFSYRELDNAVSYRVQYSPSPDFDEQVTEVNTEETAINIKNLPLGMTYVRVQATDQLGLRGAFSKTVRIIRTVDDKPPLIFVDNSRNNVLLATKEEYTINGVTEPEATLTVNGNKAKIFSSGRFTHTVSGVTDEKILELISKDPSGNLTEMSVTVVRLTEDRLYDFYLRQTPALNAKVISPGDIVFSAKAYPGLTVVINNGSQIRTILTDNQGRWGANLSILPGELTISFQDSSTEEVYFTKTFKVEDNL